MNTAPRIPRDRLPVGESIAAWLTLGILLWVVIIVTVRSL